MSTGTIRIRAKDLEKVEGISERSAKDKLYRYKKELNVLVLFISDYCKLVGGDPVMIYTFINQEAPPSALVDAWNKIMRDAGRREKT